MRTSEISTADRNLVRRLEGAELRVSENCVIAWLAAHPDSPTVAEPMAGGAAIYFGASSPLSQALSIGMDGPVTEAEFARLENFFALRGAPPVISLCPFVDSSVFERLAYRGYRITHFEHTLVRGLDDELPPSRGVPVRVIAPGEAALWSDTVMTGFTDGAALSSEMAAMFTVFTGARDSRCYLAEVDGSVAGGASASFGGGIAIFYCDSTLPAWRGRGAQSSLIARRLRDARAAGCEIAMASTFPGTASQRNYERAGFRVAYTKAMLTRDAL
ncbi:MAG: GNAT family N-acetyltransferase [Bryobacteraceae bacterium]